MSAVIKVFAFSDKYPNPNLSKNKNRKNEITPSAILEESLKRVCSKKLTLLQKRILLHIAETEHLGLTCSGQVREISRRMRIPESTVKWSIRALRDFYLIEGGTPENRGIPAKVTYPGLLIAEGLRREHM
ncbi:MAG: hypothetical protein NO515_01105 [Candidatus Methanomethylicia archaeon]|nr:hypothetical protein [Candidatus Methanomethylicia archaeon]